MTIDGNKLMMSLNDWWYSSFGHDEETEDSKAIKTVVDKIEESLKDFIPESCEDAISRADAVRVASGYCHPSNVAKELAKLPPVAPKPKVGHWINKSKPDAVTLKIYECSKCGRFAYREFDFCPNCGCPMVESQESENGNEL